MADCWEKIYLFLTPSKTRGRVPNQQGAPTTCNRLTNQEVSQKLLASLGVVIGQNSAPSLGKAVKGGGGESDNKKLGNWVSFYIGIEVIIENYTWNGSIINIPPIKSVVSMKTSRVVS